MAELIVKGTPLYMYLIMLVSCILVVCGFVLPPHGVIDGSVLSAIGELMGFGLLVDFVQKLPAIIRAGGKAKFQHGETTIEVGARKHDGFGGGGPRYAPSAEMMEESEEEGGDDGTD